MNAQVLYLSTRADSRDDNTKAAKRLEMLSSMLPHLKGPLVLQLVTLRKLDTSCRSESCNDKRWFETPVLVRYNPESHIVQECS